MIEFEHLKNSYAETVQTALLACTNSNEAKNGNHLIHDLCSLLIDTGNYYDSDKKRMKRELEMLKGTLDQEIDQYFSTYSSNCR